MKILRHALAALAVILTGTSVQAQDTHRRYDDSRPELPLYDSGRPDRFINIKPVIGIGISSVTQNYSSAIPGLSDLMLSPGAMIRAGMQVEFVMRRSFALGTGLTFDANHLRYALSIIEANTGSINSIYSRHNYYCLTVPVYLQWRLNLARRMRWDIEAGAYFSFGTGGTSHASGYTSGINSLGQPVIDHTDYKGKYYNEQRPLINGVRTLDFGPRLATGLTYRQRYSLTLVLQCGLPNVARNHGALDINYHNVALAFEIGYSF